MVPPSLVSNFMANVFDPSYKLKRKIEIEAI